MLSVVAADMSIEGAKKIVYNGTVRYQLRDNVDFDEEVTDGRFFARNGHKNSPNGSCWWYVDVLTYVNGTSIYVQQRATRDLGTEIHIRTRTDNGWQSWRKLSLS